MKIPRVLAGEGREYATQTEFRSAQCEQVTANNAPLITLPKCNAPLTHVQQFIQPALDLQDMKL